MSVEETIKLFVGFLGGGLIGAIVNALHNSRTGSIARQAEYLGRQLHELYGPLFYFAGQNERLYELTVKINAAYDAVYSKTKWSTDDATASSVENDAAETIKIASHYAHVMENNNSRMVDILTQNCALIDPEDSAFFQEFVLASIRNKIEFGAGRLAVPLRIYEHMGDIPYYQSDWVSLIKDRFHQKSSKLLKLRLGWSWKPSLQ